MVNPMCKSSKSYIIKKSLRSTQNLKNYNLGISRAFQTKKLKLRNAEKTISTTMQNTTVHGAWETKGDSLVYETEYIHDAEY